MNSPASSDYDSNFTSVSQQSKRESKQHQTNVGVYSPASAGYKITDINESIKTEKKELKSACNPKRKLLIDEKSKAIQRLEEKYKKGNLKKVSETAKEVMKDIKSTKRALETASFDEIEFLKDSHCELLENMFDEIEKMFE